MDTINVRQTITDVKCRICTCIENWKKQNQWDKNTSSPRSPLIKSSKDVTALNIKCATWLFSL